jgi:hypothetical protein
MTSRRTLLFLLIGIALTAASATAPGAASAAGGAQPVAARLDPVPPSPVFSQAIPAPGPTAAPGTKPAHVLTSQRLDGPALAAALQRQQEKLAGRRPHAAATARVPGSIAAAERLARARLATARAAAPAGAPKPAPVVTRILGAPPDAAQRAKLERAQVAPGLPGGDASAPARDQER